MIKYLESLAKKMSASQMSLPCSDQAPVAFFSEYGEPETKKRSSDAANGDALRKYFVKK